MNNSLLSRCRRTGCVLGTAGVLHLGAVSAFAASAAEEEPVTELERFIVTESASSVFDNLMPTARPVDSIYGASMSVLDTPRAVTGISSDLLERTGTQDVYSLTALVPGATVINYYGVPGIPTTRGLRSSIYFNGMLRVFNRNGYPTSFGSLEAMDYVNGPAPGTYSAAAPGGFVNFIPKTPYYDKRRGSVRMTLGRWNKFNTQMDVGGPFLLMDKHPAAFRLSITNQDADSYYDGIKNDYFSFYGSLKTQLSPTVSVYTGGEYYRHRSKENPGWNRVTQDLIDNGNYLAGVPLNDLTGPSLSLTLPSGKTFTFANTTPGTVNRAALETATPFGGSRGNFNGSFFALLNGFGDSGFHLDKIPGNADAAYLYNYLGNLASPHIVKLEGSTVLTDAQDFTNADTYLFFCDTVITPSASLKITNKAFVDAYTREKLSSYGYGEDGENFTFEDKVLFQQAIRNVNLVYGLSYRFEKSKALTEYTVEPFSRRDISVKPTLNDSLKSGGQRDANGVNFWDPFGSYESTLNTAGLFVTPNVRFSDAFSVLMSGRVDNAWWDYEVPFDLAADFNSGPLPSGGKTYTNYSISPVLKISPQLTAYATYEVGTAFQGFYVSGSVSEGDTNFQESSLQEVGLKASLLGGKLFSSVDFYKQKLVNFDTRGGIAFPQHGRGVEFQASYVPDERFAITVNAAWQRHYYDTTTIPGGFVPFTAAQFAQYAGIFYADFGGRPNPGGPRWGIPEWTAGVFARYQWANGFGVSGGPSFVDSVWGNPDKTLRLPSYALWGASVYYSNESWDLSLTGRNLFSADYFHPMDEFSANAIILKGEPMSYELSFRYKF